MKREIKFRIWCEKKKKMYEPFGLAEYMSYNEQAQDDMQPAGSENRHLLQYTGLKDKNGKEIYEGDIIHRIYIETITEKNKKDAENYYKRKFKMGEKFDDGFISEVKWIKNGWSFGKVGMFESDFKDIIIIGNTYENPELITNKE